MENCKFIIGIYDVDTFSQVIVWSVRNSGSIIHLEKMSSLGFSLAIGGYCFLLNGTPQYVNGNLQVNDNLRGATQYAFEFALKNNGWRYG